MKAVKFHCINVTVDDALSDVLFDINLVSDWSGVYSLSDVDKNVVFYIAGYLNRKLNQNTSCRQCTDSYIRSREQHRKYAGTHTALLQIRQFDWAKFGLASPSPPLYDLCCGMERIVQANIEGVIAGSCVMGSLKDVITSSISLESYPVEECCSDHRSWWLGLAVKVFLRVRIHHFVRIFNTELEEKEQVKKKVETKACKPSRKAQKAMHL
jgi:hypothetical protein